MRKQETIFKFLEINPNYADAYYYFGLLLIKLNDLEEAKNTFDKVIEIDQNYSKAYFHKARILTHQMISEAPRVTTKRHLILTRNSRSTTIWKASHGGVATDKEGTIVDKTNLPEAKKHFSLALKVNPKTPKHFTTWPESLFTRKAIQKLSRI